MIKSLGHWLNPLAPLPAWRYYAWLLVIVVQAVLAYCLAEQNNPFFYQAF